MNKKLIFILIGIALLLIIYNATLISTSAPFEGESIVAIIGIVAALCAIVLLLVYWTSKKIQQSLDEEDKK